VGQTNDKPSKRGSGTGRPGKVPRFDQSRFVQYELDEAEAAQCKAWVLSEEDAWNGVLSMVDEGYSISLKYDTYSSSYACFVQVRGDDAHINAGLILTGRGSSPYKAVKQALFKSSAIGPSWLEHAERRSQTPDD